MHIPKGSTCPPPSKIISEVGSTDINNFDWAVNDSSNMSMIMTTPSVEEETRSDVVVVNFTKRHPSLQKHVTNPTGKPQE